MVLGFEQGGDTVRLPTDAIRFPVELRVPAGFVAEDRATWPHVDGRLEYVGGRLLYMPPCGDTQQDVVPSVAAALLEWARLHREFIVGSNEAGMKLGGEVRAADAAVWSRAAVGPRTGGYRRVAPVLAVEVSGHDEDEAVLAEKAAWYLSRGVTIVWLVLPDSREVVVVTSPDSVRFGRQDAIPEHASLPGLTLQVARFFEQLDD